MYADKRYLTWLCLLWLLMAVVCAVLFAWGYAPAMASGTVTISTSGSVTRIGDYGGDEFVIGQGITPSAGSLSEFTFTIDAVAGTPVGSVYWQIRSDSGGQPGTVLLSGSVSSVSTGVNTVTGLSGYNAGEEVHLVLYMDAQEMNTGYNWTVGSQGYAGGQLCFSTNGGSSWSCDPASDAAMSITTVDLTSTPTTTTAVVTTSVPTSVVTPTATSTASGGYLTYDWDVGLMSPASGELHGCEKGAGTFDGSVWHTVDEYVVGGYERHLCVGFPGGFHLGRVARIRVVYDLGCGSSSNPGNLLYRLYVNGSQVYTFNAGSCAAHSGVSVQAIYTSSVLLTGLALNLSSSNNNVASYSGYAALKHVYIDYVLDGTATVVPYGTQQSAQFLCGQTPVGITGTPDEFWWANCGHCYPSVTPSPGGGTCDPGHTFDCWFDSHKTMVALLTPSGTPTTDANAVQVCLTPVVKVPFNPMAVNGVFDLPSVVVGLPACSAPIGPWTVPLSVFGLTDANVPEMRFCVVEFTVTPMTLFGVAVNLSVIFSLVTSLALWRWFRQS